MSYREAPPLSPMKELVECMWSSQGPHEVRVLPDGCMDLIDLDGDIVVAGPDTRAHLSGVREAATGIRFRPGVLPRLLNVPAVELRNLRVPLRELRPEKAGAPLVVAAAQLLDAEQTRSTAPWPLPRLAEVTAKLGSGAQVRTVADDAGYSARSLQRQCSAVYGYGPAMLRRVLRFRQALRLLRAGVPVGEAAARAGYADQPHLYREVRDLAGVSVGQLGSAANRSTEVPSGSATVA